MFHNSAISINDHMRAHKHKFNYPLCNALVTLFIMNILVGAFKVFFLNQSKQLTVILIFFTGIASTPVTPLLSSIPLKGKNYFVITDNGPGPSSQMRQTQN